MKRPYAGLILLGAIAVTLSACSWDSPLPGKPMESPAIDGSVTTLTYSSAEGQDLKADVCSPKQGGTSASPTGGLPAVILLHGGGFIEGSRAQMRSLCTQFADQGIVGIAIDYRLLPDHSYPAQIDDASAAVAFFRGEAGARFGIDPDHVGMLGSSAGAIVTATLAARGDSGLAAAAALSPVADMTPAGYDLGTASPEAEMSVLAYLGCASIDDCVDAKDASPLYSVSSSSTPLFLAVGSDELVPQQQVEALAGAYEANSDATDLVVVEGQKHGQALMTSKVRQRLAEFFQSYLL